MPGRVKVSGSWKDVNAVRVKVAGAWKDVAKGYTKVSGAWKEWYSSAPASAYELIETVTVGSGGAASVTFSNLNNYNTTYQHLQIRAIAKIASGGALWQTMSFNGVGGTSYASHGLVGNGSTVSGQNQTSADSIRIGFGDSDQFVASVIDILDVYETNKNKTARSLVGGHGYVDEIHLRSGFFNSTNAISSITLTTGVNYVQGSRFSIYGLKAS